MAGIRIGSGSSWMGDRIEPAEWNARRGNLDYLCFETMAEVTISQAQVRKLTDPNFPGYDPYFDDRMQRVLPHCMRRGTKIISNQGWINPVGAAERAVHWLRELGFRGVKVAAVTGNVITDRVAELCGPILETGAPVSTVLSSIVSAEAYLGAEPIVEALREGADIVLTGRVADPSLFLAPMIHEFGWDPLDHNRLGQGSGVGHLLECGAHVTGGYFCDPGFKDLPEPWNLAFPIAEVDPDGSATITKLDGTGGGVNLQTVKEQLLYEVHDPANYLTPDVTVDFTTVQLEETGPDRIWVGGISGKPRSPTLKVSIGCREGFIGEDMFFYAGEGALRRAKLAKRILEERFKIIDLKASEIRIDFLGLNAIHGTATPRHAPEPHEVAVRVAARTTDRAEAFKIGREVDGMAVSGVGMTGKRGAHQERVREVVGVWSSLAPRERINHTVTIFES